MTFGSVEPKWVMINATASKRLILMSSVIHDFLAGGIQCSKHGNCCDIDIAISCLV